MIIMDMFTNKKKIDPQTVFFFFFHKRERNPSLQSHRISSRHTHPYPHARAEMADMWIQSHDIETFFEVIHYNFQLPTTG